MAKARAGGLGARSTRFSPASSRLNERSSTAELFFRQYSSPSQLDASRLEQIIDDIGNQRVRIRLVPGKRHYFICDRRDQFSESCVDAFSVHNSTTSARVSSRAIFPKERATRMPSPMSENFLLEKLSTVRQRHWERSAHATGITAEILQVVSFGALTCRQNFCARRTSPRRAASCRVEPMYDIPLPAEGRKRTDRAPGSLVIA